SVAPGRNPAMTGHGRVTPCFEKDAITLPPSKQRTAVLGDPRGDPRCVEHRGRDVDVRSPTAICPRRQVARPPCHEGNLNRLLIWDALAPQAVLCPHEAVIRDEEDERVFEFAIRRELREDLR